jgi:AcrR family transcriptional regulator
VTPIQPNISGTVSERILLAADRLFYSKGIQAVGVDELASAAAISKRTLYKHYPSKNDLIIAYLLRRASRSVVSDGPPLDQILDIFDALEQAFRQRSFRGCPFVNAAAELGGDRVHPVVAVVKSIKLGRHAWFEDRLRALGAADPSVLACQMMLLVEGAITTSMVRGSDPQAAVAAKQAARLLLKAGGIKLD